MGVKMLPEEQIQVLHRAMDFVTDFSAAIDGGANIGAWTRVMAARFGFVYALEPAQDTFSVLEENVGDLENVALWQSALWSEQVLVSVLENPKKIGLHRSRYISLGGDVQTVTIDYLDLEHCGLIKLDLEGAELMALRGGAETIRRCKPVIVLEFDAKQMARYGYGEDEQRSFLTELGLHYVLTHGGDEVWAFGEEAGC